MALTLVTGATGFLGTAVVSQLLRAGVRLRTTGRRPQTRASLPDYRPLDLANCYTLMPLLRDVGCVIHAAGLAHQFGRGTADEAAFHQMNAMTTSRLAFAAAQAGVRRFVLISSVAVYGSDCETEEGEAALCRPATPYARSKLAAEQSLLEIAEQVGMQAIILRPVTLYGEHDPGNVGRLMQTLYRGRFIWIGGGENRKSLLHRDDAARACLLAATQPPKSCQACYNITGGVATLREIVEQLSRELGRAAPWLHVPAAVAKSIALPGSGWRSVLDKWLRDDVYCGQRFAADYTFRPRVTLAEGIRRQVAAYRGQPTESSYAKAA